MQDSWVLGFTFWNCHILLFYVLGFFWPHWTVFKALLLLFLHSRITPSGLEGLYGMLGIRSRSFMYRHLYSLYKYSGLICIFLTSTENMSLFFFWCGRVVKTTSCAEEGLILVLCSGNYINVKY